MLDAVIIGGGAAGLSAALVLGRFRRSVLICDSQQPRNAKSTGVHGFLSRDGIHPRELLQISREQLQPHSTVQLRNQEVIDIEAIDNHFLVHFQDGTVEYAKKVLFATGVKDTLPQIEGIDALFGKSVFHCPYCHGWEARDKAIAIIANGDIAMHLGKLLHSLSSDIVICTNGQAEIDKSDRDLLDHNGIRVIETPILCLDRDDTTLKGLAFADGSYLQRDAIFIRTVLQRQSSLPTKLGCTVSEQGHIIVNALGKTNVEGVFGAGDLVSPIQQVIFAASTGAAAAAGINLELAHEKFVITT